MVNVEVTFRIGLAPFNVYCSFVDEDDVETWIEMQLKAWGMPDVSVISHDAR